MLFHSKKYLQLENYDDKKEISKLRLIIRLGTYVKKKCPKYVNTSSSRKRRMFTPIAFYIIICRHGEHTAILGSVSSVYLRSIRKSPSKSNLYIYFRTRSHTTHMVDTIL